MQRVQRTSGEPWEPTPAAATRAVAPVKLAAAKEPGPGPVRRLVAAGVAVVPKNLTHSELAAVIGAGEYTGPRLRAVIRFGLVTKEVKSE